MVAFAEDRYVYEALTRFNYFPNQKNAVGEMPPVFKTNSFTPEIAELLITSANLSKERKKSGFDQVSYSVTRHNNVPRTLGLMHPYACAQLAKHIYDNWIEIAHITKNVNSMIKPEIHVDGRIMIMNYEDADQKAVRTLTEGFGKRFRVNTDISGCFNNIYTHSIPWAVLGFDQAKENVKAGGPKSHWADKLDAFQSFANRKETNGVPIGPATSSIVVELVLGAVDKALVDSGFKFNRYIDDYICFCSTYEDAQRFIRVLGAALGGLKLNINLQKTHITELPEPISDEWVSHLSSVIPSPLIDDDNGRRKLTSSEVLQYLDYAVRLNKSTPDGSVLKYAISSIMYSLRPHDTAVFRYVINLCWYYPVLIPYLDILIDGGELDAADYVEQFNSLIVENAKNTRSDGMAWPLYFLIKHKLQPSDEAISAVVESKDCVSLTCLFKLLPECAELIAFIKKVAGSSDYERDEYWLLLYQCFLKGVIDNPYNDKVFNLLKQYKVDFTPSSIALTKAEHYCDYIGNPFVDDDFKFESFKVYCQNK